MYSQCAWVMCEVIAGSARAHWELHHTSCISSCATLFGVSLILPVDRTTSLAKRFWRNSVPSKTSEHIRLNSNKISTGADAAPDAVQVMRISEVKFGG